MSSPESTRVRMPNRQMLTLNKQRWWKLKLLKQASARLRVNYNHGGTYEALERPLQLWETVQRRNRIRGLTEPCRMRLSSSSSPMR